jgi:hypothetical protein
MCNVPYSRIPVRDRKVLLPNEQGGNSAIQGRLPEQNPQYKQKSRTIYINTKRQLCMCYVYNKHVLFFVPSSIKYVFWITRFPQLSVRPRTNTADNRQHSVLAVPTSSAMQLTSPLVW